MSTDLTDIAISALVAAPITMAIAAFMPQFAWLIGVVLITLGIASVIRAFLDDHDMLGYVVGVITAIFGLATEVATVEGLVYLTAFALVFDAIMGLVYRFS